MSKSNDNKNNYNKSDNRSLTIGWESITSLVKVSPVCEWRPLPSYLAISELIGWRRVHSFRVRMLRSVHPTPRARCVALDRVSFTLFGRCQYTRNSIERVVQESCTLCTFARHLSPFSSKWYPLEDDEISLRRGERAYF